MLNKIQRHEVNRGIQLRNFLNNHTDVYKDFLPFKNEVDDLLNNVDELEAEATTKQAKSKGKGTTVTKAGLKQSTAAKWFAICSKTLGYAKKTNNEKLKALVHFTESDILYFPDADIFPFAKNLAENVFTATLLDDKLFKTYNVTAAMIADALVDATGFNNKIGEASTIETDAGTANLNINNIITRIHGNLSILDDLIVEFVTTSPDFTHSYHQNSTLEKLAVRHNGVTGVVRKGGNPFANASISIVGTNKVASTDANGHYAIIIIKAGIYTIEVSTESGDTISKTVHIRYGRIEELDFDL